MKWWILLLLIFAGLFIVLPLLARTVRFFYWKYRKDNKKTSNDNNKNNDKKEQLIELRIQMERTNFWFHLVRNNPRHREQYYFALIAIIGYENWENINPTIRMNWESARLSFDRMYGMVKDFAEHAEKYAKRFEFATIETSVEEALQPTVKAFEDLHIKLKNIGDKYKNLENQYKTISDEYAKKLKEIKEIDDAKKQLKECMESLSKFVPAESKAEENKADAE